MKNELFLSIDRKFIEENLEDWEESNGNGYLKLINGHLTEDKLQEVVNVIFERIHLFMLESFTEVENPRPEPGCDAEAASVEEIKLCVSDADC